MFFRTPVTLSSFENEKQRLFGPDAARATAILMVMASHFCAFCSSWFKTPFPLGLIVLGEFGVILFFTLSGFLIGTILITLVEKNAPLKEWGIFWARRWGRTLPAYFFWIGVLLFLSYWQNFITPWDNLKHYLLYYITLTQNLAWPMVTFWFAVSWSLTVEEWFYITFPLALLFLACFRIQPYYRFAIGFAVFFIVPITFRLMVPESANWDEAVKKVVINRLDAIAYGAFTAWVWHYYTNKLQRYVLFLFCLGVGGTLYLISMIYFPQLKLWPEYLHRVLIFNMISFNYMLCMPFLFSIKSVPTPIRSITTLISNHSYSLYITHFSIMIIAGTLIDRHILTASSAVVFSIAATLFCSWGIWRYIELPLLKHRPKQAYSAKL